MPVVKAFHSLPTPESTPASSQHTFDWSDSVGDVSSNKHGDHFYFEATGKAEEDFEELLPHIMRTLNRFHRGLSGSDFLSIQFSMAGSSREAALPTIMILYHISEPRKEAVKLIQEMPVLKDFPDFRVEDHAESMRFVAGNESGKTAARSHSNSIDHYIDTTAHRDSAAASSSWSENDSIICFDGGKGMLNHHCLGSRQPVFYDKRKPIQQFGFKIFAKTNHEEIGRVRSATANLLVVRGVVMYQTVFHIFTNQSFLSEDGLQDSDKDVNEADVFSEATVEETVNTGPPGLDIMGYVLSHSEAKDWALIEITDTQVRRRLTERITTEESKENIFDIEAAGKPERTVNVVAKTPSGQIDGILYKTPTYTCLPGISEFQQMYQVLFNSPISEGDSGSVVVDATTRRLYGYVIAEAERSGKTYIASAQRTHRDMEDLLESSVESLKKHRNDLYAVCNKSRAIAPLDSTSLIHRSRSPVQPSLSPAVSRTSIGDPPPSPPESVIESTTSSGKKPTSFAQEWSSGVRKRPLAAPKRANADLKISVQNRRFGASSRRLLPSTRKQSSIRKSPSLAPDLLSSESGPVLSDLSSSMSPESADAATVYDRAFSGQNARNDLYDEPHVQIQRQYGFTGDAIDLLLSDNGSTPISSRAAEKIRSLCAPRYLMELTAEAESWVEPSRRRAWIDDRSYRTSSESCHRTYNNPVSARILYQILQRARFGDHALPDADRRLVYIEGLDAPYIYALAETATSDQVESLRTVIAAYLSFETFFGFSTMAYSRIFRLSMYMTFPVVTMNEAFRSTQKPERWIDASAFSCTDEPHESGPSLHMAGIHTVRMTIEICGRGYNNYTVWAFADVLEDQDPLHEYEKSDFSYSINQLGLHEDPIARGIVLDANLPIFDAREYGLRLLEAHVGRAARHWTDAVDILQGRLERHITPLTKIWSFGDTETKDQRRDLRTVYQQNQRWREHLQAMEHDLSNLINDLEDFNSAGGGLEFLIQGLHKQYNAVSQRTNIRGKVRALRHLKVRLRSCIHKCSAVSKELDLHIKVMAKERTDMLWPAVWMFLQYLPPLLVVIGLASMNEHFIPVSPSITGLVVLTIVVVFAYALLQWSVKLVADDPHRARKILVTTYTYVARLKDNVERGILRLFAHTLRVRRRRAAPCDSIELGNVFA